MRVQVYEQLMAMQRSRRDVLKGAAGAAALAASSSVLSSTPSFAEDSIVSQIMKIPGAGNGSPTDADWQKVGDLCLGPTKANVKPGEFAGVEFSFMGLNNQNLHNFLFRGFLTPWEAYTGREDQVDRSRPGRLQRPPAAIDRDRHRRFRHHRDGRAVRRRHGRERPSVGYAGLGQDADRLRRLRQLPQAAGRHLERKDPPRHHRQRLPHDELSHRRLLRSGSREAVEGLEGGQGDWGAAEDLAAGAGRSPNSSRARSSRARTSTASSTSRSPGAVSGSISSRAAPRLTRNIPARKNWMFDENMKPLVNSPAWVRAIQDVVDALPSEPPDQINADRQHDRVPAVPHRDGFAPGMVGRHRHSREDERHRDDRRRPRLRHPARFGRRLQFPDAEVGEARERPEPVAQHGLSRLGHLRDEERRRR